MIRSEDIIQGALCGPVSKHRAPIGALCEGSSMQLYIARYLWKSPVGYTSQRGVFIKLSYGIYISQH